MSSNTYKQNNVTKDSNEEVLSYDDYASYDLGDSSW